MFFKVLVVAVVVTAVLAKPWEEHRFPNGSYDWRYTNPGESAQVQESYIKSNGNRVVKGKAMWYDPEGKEHEIAYEADENGVVTINSEDIPKANWDVQRALRWIAAHPEEK